MTRIRRFLQALLLTLVAGAVAPAALAYPFVFGGSGGPGASGVDTFGHIWRIQINSWGIPGLGFGTLGYAGPDSALDFHIEFFNLPQGVVIDATPAGGPGGFETTTRFSNTSDSELWTRVIGAGGTDVSFFATPTSSLENGERFFVNVVFTGNLGTAPIEFVASWTGQRRVPEPGTLALMLLGVSVVLAAHRRRVR